MDSRVQVAERHCYEPCEFSLITLSSQLATNSMQVFNLVTQQDSETNTSIARATRADSSAMKIIAALTMIFLPATAVSGFFGMVFFDNQNGEVVVTHDWWLFIATTIPITIILITIWQIWLSWTELIEGLQIVQRMGIRAWSTVSGNGPLGIPLKETADIV